MAFNLFAESPDPIDWERLSGALRSSSTFVEFFPIPAKSKEERDAIGVSLPMRHATEAGWQELERILRFLLESFHMEITELYSGRKLSILNLGEIRGRFLGT